MLDNQVLGPGMALVGLACLATPALAQSAANSSPSAPSMLALADTIPQADIIVTGERVPRSVARTSSSVAVATSEQIREQGGSDRIQDVLALVPNVQLGATGQGPTIRGQDSTGVLLGANAFLGGSRPRATVLVDGRPLSFNEFVYGLTGIWDVDRIEVYRGPQTTTQGRNAIAGAIFINTKNPTYDVEGSARVILADYDTRQLSGALSGPIVADQLAARVSVDWRDGNTFLKNPNSSAAVIGTDPGRDDFFALRAKLLAEPGALPGFRALLTLSHTKGTANQSNAVEPPFERRAYLRSTALFGTEADTAVLDVDQDLGAVTWSNRLTYADIDVRRYAAPGDGNGHIRARERSAESVIRFGRAGDRLTGLIGGYLFGGDQDEQIDLSLYRIGAGTFRDEQESRAVYGEATYALTDRLSLTAGGRYQYDRQDRRGTLGRFVVNYRESFDAFLPKAGVAYDVSPTVRVGATAARGFNPGGTTISFTTGNQDTFGAERLWNYELFIRASTPDRKLSVNANLFYTDYEDAQRPTATIGAGGQPETVFDNAEDAHGIGLELEAAYRPNARLGLRAGLGLLDTRIDRFSVSSTPIVGKDFQRSPHVTASVAVDWTPINRLTLNAQGRYSSSSYSDDLNTAALRIDSTFNLDAQASYQLGPARLFAFVRNVFDEFQVVQRYSAVLAAVNAPRRIGVGLELGF